MNLNLKNIVWSALWKVQGIKVYALIGKSGTGKSFRAQLIAEKFGLSHIIDDGLLIKGGSILAGTSAKNAHDIFTAIQIAVFDSLQHRQMVKVALSKEKMKGLLILGTSEKMLRLICERLDLPQPEKIIQIEEITTSEELQLAQIERQKGRHVIPVPALEVKKNFAQIIIEEIKVLIGQKLNWLFRKKTWEKTVVRPPFHNQGRIRISNTALIQMVIHCVEEFNAQLIYDSCKISENQQKIKINLYISAIYGLELKREIPQLQSYIKSNLEHYVGIEVGEVNIKVIKLL